jgi:L-rhamnose-H+ transport protein
MKETVAIGAMLAVVSGLMNGSFTLPMRFLGKWQWENVWSIFITFACLVMPICIISLVAPQSWGVLSHVPGSAIAIALATGFAWGFGAIMFGQSVSAIGISLANTLVLAISSALGSFMPMLLLHPEKLMQRTGQMIILGVAIQVFAIALCGWAGHMREKAAGISADRGNLVGQARSIRVGLLLATGAGVFSGVFNIGFSLAQPIAQAGRASGLSDFSSANLIWLIMLGAGLLPNLGFCVYLFRKNRSFSGFRKPGVARLYTLTVLMALLWGGSVFVYGAAAPRLGALGTAIGWPLSLATGLVLANVIGLALGEWRQAPRRARGWMYSGLVILLVAIVVLSRAG